MIGILVLFFVIACIGIGLFEYIVPNAWYDSIERTYSMVGIIDTELVCYDLISMKTQLKYNFVDVIHPEIEDTIYKHIVELKCYE